MFSLRTKLVYNVFSRGNFFCRQFCNNVTVEAKVAQGTVVGLQHLLPDNRPYYAFKGIPYAEPPIGELRFKPPVALEKFSTDFLDCSKERDVCIQRDIFAGTNRGSENCLHLNVYSPSMEKGKKLPVMVWIHGGAFLAGNGNSEFYGPDWLVERDVVVVTLNYRLGAFGFLCLPEAGINGNMGMKDQILVLKWVQQNIEQFGGDPKNVTLFGESAGAACVHLHTLSPVSTQYFHKAIVQTGTSLMEWVIQRNSEFHARNLAQLVNCTATDNKSIGEYLTNKVSTSQIFGASNDAITPDEKRRGLPIVFRPAVDGDFSDDPILPEKPLTIMKRRNALKIPTIIGYTSHEGMIMLSSYLRKIDELENDFARLVPRSLNILNENESSKAAQDFAQEIRNFYLDGEPLTKENSTDLIHLISDYHFTIISQMSAEIHAKYQPNTPTWFFRFSHDGKLNLMKKFYRVEHLSGACHSDENFYLFRTKFADVPLQETDVSYKIRSEMCEMWTNFAKFGKPKEGVWNNVQAKENEKFTLDYLEIGDEIEPMKNPDKSRMDFWKHAYTKYNGSFLNPTL